MPRLLQPLARATLAASAALALAGCSLLYGGDVEIAQPVEGPVVLTVRAYEDEEVRHHLVVFTEESYTCLLPLALDADGGGSRLRVEVLGIAEVEVCATAIGPAMGRVPLDLEPGTYTLELMHLGQRDEYRLTVGADVVGVETVRAEVSRYVAAGGF